MSVSRFLATLAGLGLIVVALVGASVLPILLDDHDGWDIVRPVGIEAEPLILDPPALFNAEQRATIRATLMDSKLESREFGIPWTVMAVSDSTIPADVPAEDYAQQVFDELQIGTSPDADDGMLMFVAVPEDDPTETTVHFVAGANFYPEGGITPERLRWIADVQMAPLISDGEIGEAVIEGAMWIEWMQLFEPPPNPAPTTLQTGLSRYLHPLGTIAVAGMALMISGAAVAVTILTRRGVSATSDIRMEPVHAAALSNGRVTGDLLDGVVQDARARGVLPSLSDETEGMTRDGTSRYDAHLVSAAESVAGHQVQVTRPRLTRWLRRTGLPRVIEDDLAMAGWLHPRSALFDLGLRVAGVAGAVAGVVVLVLSVAGEARETLAAALVLTVISLAVLIWTGFRSWTTNAGSAALAAWLRDSRVDDPETYAFYTIVGEDRVSPTTGPNRQMAV